jgi:sugar/nucleoside kinase (ribokinase family)
MKIDVFGPTYIDHTIELKDDISLDGSSRIENETYYPGGTGLCYAIALARLNNETTINSVVGNDNNSKIVYRFINSETNLIPKFQKLNGQTDYAYILIDKGSHKTVASRKEVSNKFNTKKLKFKNYSDAVVITSFSNEICSEIIKYYYELSNKPFIMWAPHQSNLKNMKLIKDSMSFIDHITLSLDEYNQLYERIGDPLKKGVKSITITLGENGCDLLSSEGMEHFNAVSKIKDPLDTNGAGEAFGAGFLTTYLNTNNLHQSVKLGCYLGYLHIQRKGSDFPRLDLNKLLLIEGQQFEFDETKDFTTSFIEK